MTTVVDITMVGRICTFRTKNTSDATTWQGKIEGIGSSAIAQRLTDIVAYNAAVRQVDPTVNADPTMLSYFIITLSNVSNQQQYAFSPDWIIDGSFTLIDQLATVQVVVYDSETSDHTGILTALRAAGYTCYISGVTS